MLYIGNMKYDAQNTKHHTNISTHLNFGTLQITIGI